MSSVIHIREPVRVYENGYFENILSIFLDGYWGTEYTISTLLPLDFAAER